MHHRTPLALFGLLLLTACGTTVPVSSAPVPTAPPSGAQQSSPPPSAQLTGATPVGARALLDQARDVAVAVAPDATLVRVASQRGADFDVHTPDGTAPNWLFTFVSAANGTEINVAASTVEVALVMETEVPVGTVAPLPTDWVDSPTAFSAAQAAGGSDYLAANPQKRVYYDLGVDPETSAPLWTLRYSAQVRDGLLSYRVNAVDGTYVDTQRTLPSGVSES